MILMLSAFIYVILHSIAVAPHFSKAGWWAGGKLWWSMFLTEQNMHSVKQLW